MVHHGYRKIRKIRLLIFLPFGAGNLTTTLTYDAVGRTTSIQDANGNLSQFYYDPATGDLLRTVQGLAEARFTYDRFGNLTSMTDPGGVVTTFTYDALNRLIRRGKVDSQNAQIVFSEAIASSATTAKFHVETNKAFQNIVIKYRVQGTGSFMAVQASDVLSNLMDIDIGELKPNTTYEYLVEGTDLQGHSASYAVHTFQTPSLTSSIPLVLTNRVDTTTANSANVNLNLASGSFVGNVTLTVTPSQGGASIVLNRSIIPGSNNIITVSGLSANTEYVYTLFAQNLVGNTYYPLITSPIAFRTSNPLDHTGPVVITNKIKSIMSTKAYLNLATDEPLAKVHLTITPTQGGTPIEIDYFTPKNGEDIEIANLLSNTDYTYTMTLTDFSGNTVTTASQTFKTSILESEPPQIIMDVPVDIKADHATIRIQTNEPLSRVMLTLLPADSLIPQEFKFGSSTDLTREFTLTGLRPGVTYYYFVTVIDASGNMTQSVSHGEFHTRAI